MKRELILEIIRERWSPYAISSAPVEEFKLKAMFEAAGCAPSANNEQPWLFVYTTRDNPEIFDRYVSFLNDGNKAWAKHAYALIISMARMTFAGSGKPNRYALYDTGMAVSNILLQAESFDLFVHQMGGYSVEMVREYLKLGEDIQPIAMMAAGYLGDGAALTPELLKRDEARRPRKSVTSYVFHNSMYEEAFRCDPEKMSSVI